MTPSSEEHKAISVPITMALRMELWVRDDSALTDLTAHEIRGHNKARAARSS